jgi:hypothetical protein
VNSKQVVAAASMAVLIVIIVYPALSVGTVSFSLASAKISKADHVYVTIDRVWAHPKGQASGEGWVIVSNQSVSADLVSLQNSSKFLGSGQIASGDYDAIRIEVSNVTWVFNKTTTNLGVASPEINGSIDFTVGTAKSTTILITVSSQKELIANSEYFTGTLNATLTM